MIPARWQQIPEILHAALQRSPSERAAFLDQACHKDPSVRLEVESLLCGAGCIPRSASCTIGAESEPLREAVRTGQI
jgi:hypothetical protein